MDDVDDFKRLFAYVPTLATSFCHLIRSACNLIHICLLNRMGALQ